MAAGLKSAATRKELGASRDPQHAQDLLQDGFAVSAPRQLRKRQTRRADEIRAVVKRGLDLGCSAGMLLVSSPVLLAAVVAIRLDSPGPALFVQQRGGSVRVKRDGLVWWEPHKFGCYKFRTMLSDADDEVHRSHIKSFVSGDVEVKITEDARVTRVGRLLRRTSFDELPQLLNVLKGNMSLVGPRPVPLYEVAEYEEWHYDRLAAKPGMTGVWQVHGRGRVGFTEMMEMDIDYVRRPSLRRDLRVMIETLPAVLTGKGAT